jgi:glycyl-tRNA synthetase
VKVPFGIAQVGKSFRNEINPRNYTFRSREFEQMEIEFFCHPDESMEWYEFWRERASTGTSTSACRARSCGCATRTATNWPTTARACADIEYLFPFSEDFQELEGVAHRGCYDLTQHQSTAART